MFVCLLFLTSLCLPFATFSSFFWSTFRLRFGKLWGRTRFFWSVINSLSGCSRGDLPRMRKVRKTKHTHPREGDDCATGERLLHSTGMIGMVGNVIDFTTGSGLGHFFQGCKLLKLIFDMSTFVRAFSTWAEFNLLVCLSTGSDYRIILFE